MIDLPQPERRKRATPKQILEILLRQNGRCAICEKRIGEGALPYQIDHIQRLDALGDGSIDNLQALCVEDHKAKTRIDNREAKKGARVRGETGQRARREKRGGSSIKSAGFKAWRKFDGTIVRKG